MNEDFMIMIRRNKSIDSREYTIKIMREHEKPNGEYESSEASLELSKEEFMTLKDVLG